VDNSTVWLRRSLLKWWDLNGRHHIPWKKSFSKCDFGTDALLDPYPIWIAEVMLQQTQLSVMLPYWERWMFSFPTLDALAESALDQVLYQWQGLGYYARARRLHKAAKQLVGAPLPRSVDQWMALPGIGRTTAGSIVSSAFNDPEPILDGNVKRVIARLYAFPSPPSRDLKLFWQWSEALLDPLRPRDFNQALMDLGATICIPRNPACGGCPWRSCCAAYAFGDPVRWPKTDNQKVLQVEMIGIGVVTNSAGEVLIDQRLQEGVLGGMWEFPGGKQEPGETIEACIARELKEELDIAVTVGEQLVRVDHAFSHKKLRLLVHMCDWVSGDPQPLASQKVRWVRPEALKNYPFPAANSRIIEVLLGKLADSGQAQGSCDAA